ncbi:hypothetical protein N7373_21270 [Achromobacter mucicolens]|nr:hypothetical protein [Achromobacter mucicolens]MDH0093983.1 hypothetical protein [Achromobacter mucicolens]
MAPRTTIAVCRYRKLAMPVQSDLRLTFTVGDEFFEVIEFAL